MQLFYQRFYRAFTTLLIVIVSSGYSSSSYGAEITGKTINTFRSPLDGKMELNGNYGEIRPNHFHAGIDLRTHPSKNLPIYSIEDGYVSRIKVSASGYGKVLYVTHPNGLVSVYAHQHHFNGAIGDYVKKRQYEKEIFEIELFPKADELKLKKGDIIGYTGNTGNSQGPHLHFEIRDEKSETPLNPLKYYEVTDVIAPKISAIYFYDLNNSEQATIHQSISIDESKKEHWVKNGVTGVLKKSLQLNSCFGIGISAFDTETLNGNKNQLFGVEISLDNEKYIHYEFDNINFDQMRYVNCFAEQLPSVKKHNIQRCFLSLNEELGIFKEMKNNGEFILKDTLLHVLKIRVYDLAGNEKSILLNIKRSPKIHDSNKPIELRSCLNEWFKESSDYRILIPEKTFYTNYKLQIDCKNGSPNYSSKILHLNGTRTPLFKAIEIALKPTVTKGINKLCVIDMISKEYCGGEFTEGMVKGESKTLGSYALVYDTIAPVIKPLFKKSIKRIREISYFVQDNLSGLDHFRLVINNKWVLAEYDHKTRKVFYEPSLNEFKGKTKLVLEVWDKKGNKENNTLEIEI